MIGKQVINLESLPKIGDRDDFLVQVIGPGDTDYKFPVSITRTVSSIWGLSANEAVTPLVSHLFRVAGTAKAPPEEGFWFDSYNSGSTLKETQNRILNSGITPFTKDSINSRFEKQFGNDLFKLKEEMNSYFDENHNEELFRSFEDAFEDSQAIEDLNNPPKDKAHFLYRICILSVFIDHFQIGKPTSIKKCSKCGCKETISSLRSFRLWLQKELDVKKANELIMCFQMVKNLRKQYPIHEEFEIKSEGVREVRSEKKKAKEYFSLSDKYEDDWNKTMQKFVDTLKAIRNELDKHKLIKG